jgi:hypothetical protein
LSGCENIFPLANHGVLFVLFAARGMPFRCGLIRWTPKQTFLLGRILPDGRESLSNEPHTLTTNMGATTSHCEEAEPVEVRPSAVVVSSPPSRRSIFLVERRASVREEKKP